MANKNCRHDDWRLIADNESYGLWGCSAWYCFTCDNIWKGSYPPKMKPRPAKTPPSKVGKKKHLERQRQAVLSQQLQNAPLR